MKLTLTTCLAIALALSITGNCVQLYLAGGHKAKAELKQANGVITSDRQQAKATAARDGKGDKIDLQTKADTNAKVGKTEGQKNERAAAIDSVRVDGSCRAPVGLPDLTAAVGQANAAAGH